MHRSAYVPYGSSRTIRSYVQLIQSYMRIASKLQYLHDITCTYHAQYIHISNRIAYFKQLLARLPAGCTSVRYAHLTSAPDVCTSGPVASALIFHKMLHLLCLCQYSYAMCNTGGSKPSLVLSR